MKSMAEMSDQELLNLHQELTQTARAILDFCDRIEEVVEDE